MKQQTIKFNICMGFFNEMCHYDFEIIRHIYTIIIHKFFITQEDVYFIVILRHKQYAF